MNILFVSTSSNPFDGTGWGATQRTNLLFEACAQVDKVDVVAFVDGVVSTKENCRVIYSGSDERRRVKEGRFLKLLRMFAPWNPYSVFPKDEFRFSVVKEACRRTNYDYIVCRYIPSAMECGLLEFANRLVIDIDDHPLDIEKTLYRTSRTWRNRLYHRYRSMVIKKALNRIQDACHFTFYSNPNQAVFANSSYLPNIPFYECEMEPVDFRRTGNRILFVGNMSYGPNQQGIEKFISEVMPLIQEQVPDVKLHLVGGCNNTAFIDRIQCLNNVEYMGVVDNLVTEYNEAKVVVAPIYGGAGTNIKVLESMRMKRPCVTTIFGVRGFMDFFQDQRHLSIASDANDYAGKVESLLLDEQLNHGMAELAYEVVCSHFSRAVFFKTVRKVLR